ncbi:glycine cleavage system protein GcvH [Candidatus Bathyarchaeota archaeon]|nr:MAG: glycine cleavage system protein GcvH [Candidatus Bathyarchaeota archaeon]
MESYYLLNSREVRNLVKVDEYEVLEGLYYSEDYMWVKVEDGKARVGITDYAQKQLREIVFVELPSEGDEVTQGEPFGTVESVKAVSDLVAPLSGTVESVNEEVVEKPEMLNENPYEAWLIVVKPSNLDEELKKLMSFDESVEWHKKLIKEG